MALSTSLTAATAPVDDGAVRGTSEATGLAKVADDEFRVNSPVVSFTIVLSSSGTFSPDKEAKIVNKFCKAKMNVKDMHLLHFQ